MSTCFPLCPRKQTLLDAVGMSPSCHEETHAPQQISKLFDDLVSERQERGRYGKAETISSIASSLQRRG
jgi:hypothetical protein